MYPFGSGMPQPTPPVNNHTQSMQSNIPFGAGGWSIMPRASQQNAGYPTQNQSVGGPSYTPAQTAPYPQSNPPYPSQMPYPSVGGCAAYATAKPNIYPGSSYPHNPQQAQYPSSHGNPNNQSSYQHSNTTSQTPTHNPYTSYPPNHGYQTYSTSSGSGSPAINMANCFSEMTHRQSQGSAKKEGTPTVTSYQNFDPAKDAHDLRKAMKGFGTDEDTLINIICRRTNEQRLEIQRQYKTHFGKDLIEDIKSETSGNFEKLLVGLLLPIVDFYCTELCDAMSGIGTDEEILIEILCTLSNFEIHTIKNAYLRMYGAHLESELQSETSGNFKRLLVSLCAAGRDESGHIDPAAAQNDARELLRAGELRVGTDESMFNMILCQRNYSQLKLVFQEYQNMAGHSLEKAMKKEFSGDILSGLLAIYKCVTNKAEYFASRLHKSMAGIGTNDKQLIRVIISRSEIDMQEIKVAFERMYGKSLKSWIKGDTSGHYKHALYALIGEQRSS